MHAVITWYTFFLLYPCMWVVICCVVVSFKCCDLTIILLWPHHNIGEVTKSWPRRSRSRTLDLGFRDQRGIHNWTLLYLKYVITIFYKHNSQRCGTAYTELEPSNPALQTLAQHWPRILFWRVVYAGQNARRLTMSWFDVWTSFRQWPDCYTNSRIIFCPQQAQGVE